MKERLGLQMKLKLKDVLEKEKVYILTGNKSDSLQNTLKKVMLLQDASVVQVR